MYVAIALAIIAISWAVSVNKRANKLQDQRDNLLNLLDSEGRGREALEVMG